jgi:glycosyltransferase involved in cell wall biosynthesis
MRVLWFTNTPSLYKQKSDGYNGGGWISSLEYLISKRSEVELAVSFLHNDKCFKVDVGATTYYPISLYNTAWKKVKHQLFYSSFDDVEVRAFLRVIEDFKPDIIHIFGTEKSFGLISKFTKIPIVIHVQGLLIPYLNAFFPPGSNAVDYVMYLHLKENIRKQNDLRFFHHNAKRESTILKSTNNFMGRTSWDKRVVELYSPGCNYYVAGEILRDAFYSATPWKKNFTNVNFSIVTTISKVDYKGFDLILKTASLLMELTSLKFVWKIFGIEEYRFWERKLKTRAIDVNVILMGIASEAEIIDVMRASDVYVHPSYIDNSPNSLCEAQILGMPIISTNVGGISSLIRDGESGVLIPANDPFTLAATIMELKENSAFCDKISSVGRLDAQVRHDPASIVNQVFSIYEKIQVK